MPEILEVEAARALIEERALGRPVAQVVADDAWYLKRGLVAAGLAAALTGRSFETARRRGKLMLIDTGAVLDGRARSRRSPSPAPADGSPAARGPVLGLHLGMSGRVVIDGVAAGDPLIYASNREVEAWHRFGVRFADGGSMWLRDPRRLGAVELDPDEERLGPDAYALTKAYLATITARSHAPIKAVLMDQSRVAGLGNLLTDEALWRAGVDPAREASTLGAETVAGLYRAIRQTLRTLGRRGGSHTGDMPRGRDAHCPRDGTPLARRTVGGRTTFSCPLHQQ